MYCKLNIVPDRVLNKALVHVLDSTVLVLGIIKFQVKTDKSLYYAKINSVLVHMFCDQGEGIA